MPVTNNLHNRTGHHRSLDVTPTTRSSGISPGGTSVEETPSPDTSFEGVNTGSAARPIPTGDRQPSTPLHGAFLSVAGEAAATNGALIAEGPNAAALQKVMDLAKAGRVKRSELVNEHPYTSDNKVELLVNGTEAFPKIFEAIDKAQDSINVCYFIWHNDDTGRALADRLVAKAKEGVEVNVMIDGSGNSTWGPSGDIVKVMDRLREAGVNVIENRTFQWGGDAERWFNHPDHRKLVIVDGEVGFTGGMNVADYYVSEYHDLHVKMEGPLVEQMQAEFLLTWMHLGGRFDTSAEGMEHMAELYFPEPEPAATSADSGDAPGGIKARVLQAIPGENKEIMRAYLEMIEGAQESIQIENPYLTNPEIQEALMAAAKRGVKVDVILPGTNDVRISHLAAMSKYPALRKAGINILAYPGMTHGKLMVVDNKRTTIGTSNLDDVALRHIYELNILVEDEGFARECTQRVFDKDIPISDAKRFGKDGSMLDKLTGSFFSMLHDVI